MTVIGYLGIDVGSVSTNLVFLMTVELFASLFI